MTSSSKRAVITQSSIAVTLTDNRRFAMIYVIFRLLLVFILIIVVMFTAIIPALILRLIGLGKLGDRLVFWHAAVIANFCLFLAGVRVHVSGNVEAIRERVKKGEGFCFVSNHTSILDIILMLGQLRARAGFVAKRELLFVPFLNVLIAMTHSVFINRKNLKKSVEAIRKATDNIKKGHSMVIFPEGTRSKTGEIAPFKHGSFRLATESGAYVVPLTVKGVRDSFEGRKRIFQVRDAYLHVGDPLIAPDPKDREKVSAFVGEIENSIKDTYSKL